MAFDDRGSLLERAARRVRRWLVGSPTRRSDAVLSYIHAGDTGAASQRLIEIALEACRFASHEDLSEVSDRILAGPRWPDLWPGEHYRLLASLVRVLRPTTVIEIGTFRGLGTLSLAKHLPVGAQVVSFDVIDWHEVEGSALRASDVDSGRIELVRADLTEAATFERHRPVLESAQLLFVDAAKDGRMENILLERFETLRFQTPPLLVLDDVRLWNMLAVWDRIRRPRLDLCSFGHWSGTGLVDWTPRDAVR